jgi:hypothetical protein
MSGVAGSSALAAVGAPMRMPSAVAMA